MVTLILPAADILNGVAAQVGARAASSVKEVFAVAVMMELPAEPAAVPIARVAAPSAVRATVLLMTPPNTTAFAGIVSLFVGVQLAPPSTVKSYSACATRTPVDTPVAPGRNPFSRTRTVGSACAPPGAFTPLACDSSAVPMTRLPADVDV